MESKSLDLTVKSEDLDSVSKSPHRNWSVQSIASKIENYEPIYLC